MIARKMYHKLVILKIVAMRQKSEEIRLRGVIEILNYSTKW